MTKADEVAMVSYAHTFSRNLKRKAKRSSAEVVFSAAQWLQGLCKKVKSGGKDKPVRVIKHRKKFVNCSEVP